MEARPGPTRILAPVPAIPDKPLIPNFYRTNTASQIRKVETCRGFRWVMIKSNGDGASVYK